MQGLNFTAKGTGSSTPLYRSSNDNFTLSLSGYGSQDGTVTSLRNYNAMYGTSSTHTPGLSTTISFPPTAIAVATASVYSLCSSAFSLEQQRIGFI